MPRYQFDEFVLSPRRRLLLRGGTEQPLIPRYFDLLVFLVEHRHEAVHRRDIFDRVWSDSIVSESALSQAIRTIRRALGDDPRDPRFIRTVSRHGYRFVFPEVVEEDEDEAPPPAHAPAAVSDATLVSGVQLESPDTVARLAVRGSGYAAAGGALAGIAAGAVGGLILAAAPGSTAPIAIVPVLAVVAGVCGGLGGAGVGAGLFLAAAAAPSRWTLALTVGAALGGGLIGSVVQWLTRWALAALVGLNLDIGGGVEGVVIGACAGLGCAIATRNREDRFVAAHGRTRLNAALIVAVSCGMAGLALTLAGRPLAGGTIHTIADAAEGSRATLAPLGRLIGEPGFGPTSRTILAIGECALFGFGLTLGLLRPPRDP